MCILRVLCRIIDGKQIAKLCLDNRFSLSFVSPPANYWIFLTPNTSTKKKKRRNNWFGRRYALIFSIHIVCCATLLFIQYQFFLKDKFSSVNSLSKTIYWIVLCEHTHTQFPIRSYKHKFSHMYGILVLNCGNLQNLHENICRWIFKNNLFQIFL